MNVYVNGELHRCNSIHDLADLMYDAAGYDVKAKDVSVSIEAGSVSIGNRGVELWLAPAP